MSNFRIQPMNPYHITGSSHIEDARPIAGSNPIDLSKDTDKLPGIQPASKDESADTQCQTCENRKYQDGSDEMVSFKNAAHISPESAGSVVRAHEQEHVRNAYAKAATKNGKVLSASVTLKTAICPECGRSYVSGGTTRTQIKYYNEENPYQKDLKIADHTKYGGMNADYSL